MSRCHNCFFHSPFIFVYISQIQAAFSDNNATSQFLKDLYKTILY